MIVVAPTGVAAINAGGVTMHSFFQLPFGPVIPGFKDKENQGFKRFSREKRNIIKSLDLLVIDEISMVRADLLDAVDDTLRRFRRNSKPFGGVQLLMIGDMQQLAPVVKEDEWRLLRKHYDSMFFFSSKALRQTEYVSIELKHVYRQSDQAFITLLNKIRDDKVDREAEQMLADRYDPNFDGSDEGYIILTTHNARANQVNNTRLDAIGEKTFRFEAEIRDNFPEHSYPTQVKLELKKGAQVMFIKNDPDPEKRFYNGKIGKVIALDDDDLTVACEGDEAPIEVQPIEWQNMKYTIDERSKEIHESVEGTFTQLPLKLAWAITIHKSQGLTFDKAIIDPEKAFAYGQIYVALSRCRSLEGLVLKSPFTRGAIKKDATVDGFNKEVATNPPDEQQLSLSKKMYQLELLLDLFDFKSIQRSYLQFIRQLEDNRKSIQPGIAEPFRERLAGINKNIVQVFGKFQQQLQQMFNGIEDAESNSPIQERIKKAAGYFREHADKLISDHLTDFYVDTDNREVERNITGAFDQLTDDLEFKTACLDSVKKGFVVSKYLSNRALASMERSKPKKKKASKPTVSEDIDHPGLYQKLKAWRDEKAEELNVPHFMVLQLKTMRALTNQLPVDEARLNLVHGFGKKKLERYGSEIAALISKYVEENGLEVTGLIPSLKAQKKPRVPTRQLSYELWLEKKDVAAVAVERGLVISTVEGHLAYFVEQGKLPVTDFVEPKTLNRLENFFETNGDMSLSEAKARLGDEVSYRDLKFVRAHLSQQI